MGRWIGRFVVAALAVGLVSTSFTAVAGGATPPPTLTGEYFFLYNPAVAESGSGGFTVSCDADGTSTITYDTATPTAYETIQFVPDAGYFDPDPTPIPRAVPYGGPVELQVTATMGPHTLPAPSLDFTTGWYNEQQGTRGLAAAPLESVTGSFRVETDDATVEGTLSLPVGQSGFGSCYDDLAGQTVESLPTLASGFQYRVRALVLEYDATITTTSGTYLDSGFLALSLRGEHYLLPSGGSATGHGVEAIFTSSLPDVESTDSEPPTITCSPVHAVLHQPGVVVEGSVSDSDSGPAQAVVSAPADTSTVGTHSVELTASDLAGNVATTTCSYSVEYVFSGFRAPVDNAPTVNSVQAGSSIPVKWRVTDFYGVGVSDPAHFANLSSGATSCAADAPRDEIESTSNAVGLQYQGDGNWQYVWKTPKSYGGCRVMGVDLADGTAHLALFLFR